MSHFEKKYLAGVMLTLLVVVTLVSFQNCASYEGGEASGPSGAGEPTPTPGDDSQDEDCTRTLGLGTESRWNQIFRSEWPGPKSEQVVLQIPRNSYLSVEFNTGQVNDSGSVHNFEASATVGSRLIAISRCPGDFNVEPECKYAVHTYSGTGIIWSTVGAPGYCSLEKDKTYYWNTTFTNGVDPDSTECTGSYCNTNLRVWNSDFEE